MAGIQTEDLLDRITKKQFNAIRLRGLQDGEFCVMLIANDGIFIHDNKDGSYKRYRKVENAIDWLKRKTQNNSVEIDITLWKENERTSNF